MTHDLPRQHLHDDIDLEILAKVMDDLFVVPGTNFRFGLDAVIGLVPGVGDLIAGSIGSYLIWRAHQMGASRLTLWRMAGNTALDTTLGAIPILGDLFDMRFRANRRNLELLRRHRQKMAARQEKVTIIPPDRPPPRR